MPTRSASGDPSDLVASLRAQIPDEHRRFVAGLLERYRIPALQKGTSARGEADMVNTDATMVDWLLEVVFAHRPTLVANALGPPPPNLLERARVDLLVGNRGGRAHRHHRHDGVDPEVVDIVGALPVLVAGGIASGPADGSGPSLSVRPGCGCGSIWLSSAEDTIAEVEIPAGNERDQTLRSLTRTGKPARQLRSAWHDEWEKAGSPTPLAMPVADEVSMGLVRPVRNCSV